LEWRCDIPMPQQTCCQGDFRCLGELGLWGLVRVQLEWSAPARGYHISFKELFAGLVSCAVWGRSWHGCRVRWRCDNQAAVHAVNRRSCRDRSMMRLVRCLFFSGGVVRIRGRLTRNRRFSKAKSPDPRPTVVPLGLRELLLERDGWTSPRWTRLFFDTVTERYSCLNEKNIHIRCEPFSVVLFCIWRVGTVPRLGDVAVLFCNSAGKGGYSAGNDSDVPGSGPARPDYLRFPRTPRILVPPSTALGSEWGSAGNGPTLVPPPRSTSP
jgi:hypothetical protein